MANKVSLKSLRKEHEAIERELLELETLLEDFDEGEEFNHTNCAHVLKKLFSVWDSHETKERMFFDNLNRKSESRSEIPINTLHFNNPELSGHKKVLTYAINSGDISKLKTSLDTDGRMLMEKLRRDIKKDSELYDKILNRSKA